MKYLIDRSFTVKFRILLLALAFITFHGPSLFGVEYFWNVDADGAWKADSNWTPDPPSKNKGPNAAGDIVNLGSIITLDRTITIPNPNRTIGSLIFDNLNKYTLTGSKLIFSDSVSAAITITSGSHEIQLAIDTSTATTITQNYSAGTLTLSGALTNLGNLVTIAGSGDTTISGAISGLGGVTKSGSGTLTFSGTNTYTGSTTVSAGTLTLSSVGDAIAASSAISINGGTLLLGAANQIADTAALTFGGGIFNTGGFSDTLGTLTLSANSTIDLGAGASVLTFGSAGTWTSLTELTINSWSGSVSGGGTDQLIFTSSPTGTQLGQIIFFNPAGFDPGTFSAVLVGSEIVPVPEASSMIGAGLLSGLIILDILRRRKQRRKDEENEAA